MSFEAIVRAAERAKPQFSEHGNPEDNCAVLKEMALDIFRAFYGLVEDAGGDPDIIKTWIDGVPNDFDYAFADAIEQHSERTSKAATANRCVHEVFRPILSSIVGAEL